MDVRATIVATELVRPSDSRRSRTSGSRSSSRSKEALAIIIATELESSCDHRRNRTPSFASILAIDAIIRDHHREQA
jgi:hypothetical protein